MLSIVDKALMLAPSMAKAEDHITQVTAKMKLSSAATSNHTRGPMSRRRTMAEIHSSDLTMLENDHARTQTPQRHRGHNT